MAAERLLFMASAMYDFGGDPARGDVLSFSQGTTFEIWDNSGEHYWYAKVPDTGAYGYVPASYLQVVQDGSSLLAPPAAAPKRPSIEGGVAVLPTNVKISRSMQNLDQYSLESEGQGTDDGQPRTPTRTRAVSSGGSKVPGLTDGTLRVNKLYIATKAEENNTWQSELEKKKVAKEKAAAEAARGTANPEVMEKLAKMKK